MFIEQPPWIYRVLFKGSIWRLPSEKQSVYLTFDDGPIPEVTPWVLETLDRYKVKATFFCVGENVFRYPEVFQEVLDRGHRVGNHTYNHIQGIRFRTEDYLKNIEEADTLIQSNLFRPPHGHMKLQQLVALKQKYRIIMWDVVTRDYSPHMTAQGVLNVVKKYTRNGSILVFHDSIKAIKRTKKALPQSIEWLLNEGYQFNVL